MQAIVEFTGGIACGKTTLTTILGEELSLNSILYIDASPDQKLTQLLAPESPHTLAAALNQLQASSGNREAIDWAFNDLTVSTGEEGEILTAGDLPHTLEPALQEPLQYGLLRLVKAYEYLIIDGFHP